MSVSMEQYIFVYPFKRGEEKKREEMKKQGILFSPEASPYTQIDGGFLYFI